MYVSKENYNFVLLKLTWAFITNPYFGRTLSLWTKTGNFSDKTAAQQNRNNSIIIYPTDLDPLHGRWVRQDKCPVLHICILFLPSSLLKRDPSHLNCKFVNGNWVAEIKSWFAFMKLYLRNDGWPKAPLDCFVFVYTSRAGKLGVSRSVDVFTERVTVYFPQKKKNILMRTII